MTSKPLEYHVASSMFGLNKSYLKDSFKPFSGAKYMQIAFQNRHGVRYVEETYQGLSLFYLIR